MRSIQAADCVCNQATPHPADPIKCHRARRERRHPKAAHNRSGSEWPPLDSLENKIGTIRTSEGSARWSPTGQKADLVLLGGKEQVRLGSHRKNLPMTMRAVLQAGAGSNPEAPTC